MTVDSDNAGKAIRGYVLQSLTASQTYKNLYALIALGAYPAEGAVPGEHQRVRLRRHQQRLPRAHATAANTDVLARGGATARIRRLPVGGEGPAIVALLPVVSARA